MVGAPPAANATWTHPGGHFTVQVSANPFGLTVLNRSGATLLESAPAKTSTDPTDPLLAYAPLALTHNEDATKPAILYGWDYYRGQDGPWQQAPSVTAFETQGTALVVHLATLDPSHPTATLSLDAQGDGLHIVASVDPGAADDPEHALNRISLAWSLHPDPTAAAAGQPGDHFLGFGGRFVNADHKGQLLYTFVEDAGFGHGEGTPPGPANPSPNGEGMAYMPIPWFMSPRGFGMLMNEARRTLYHLGDDAPDAWRVEAWDAPGSATTTAQLDMTLFEDPDPKALLEELTAITGRPPAIADYVLAPRRRVDPGSGEDLKLRAANIPTTVADLDVHYFPNGGGADSAAMQAMTADFHNRGFKVVAYFCPFVSNGWHPVFDDAAANGYLVKHPDGTPYVVLDTPYSAGMVDFTNPAAVAWYQGFLQQALTDGWDGWMYDFAEYVPLDALMANGMSGAEAHNIYPLLYQKAAFDILEKARRKDYLTFVRSGYAGPTPQGTLGTGGLVPMMWGGDNSTDFDLAKGLPATLTAALNVGMSGVPLWGSDISGYDFVFNPPPDKEVYLRWTELGAFSADMHDENEGTGMGGTAARWQIWDDQESTDTYRKYATLKTQMIPYTKLAVAQAQARGTPIMRHLFLDYPGDPNVYTLSDEYMLGDSLLVAPVVQRGLTQRPVYLPEASYFDFFSGARVVGSGTIMAAAPLDNVPVYAKIGAIVPLLSADIQTIAPDPDKSVTALSDRASFLEVAVFAGGQTSVTLDDGTLLSQSAPTSAFTPGAATTGAGKAIPVAASQADLMTCSACTWDDPASHVWSVAVNTAAETITAGPLTVAVAGAPAVKQFLFSVRH